MGVCDVPVIHEAAQRGRRRGRRGRNRAVRLARSGHGRCYEVCWIERRRGDEGWGATPNARRGHHT